MPRIEASWHDFYKAAIFESDPEKLSIRIEEADTAIRLRIAELPEQGSSKERKERMELDSCLYFLEVLRTISDSERKRLQSPRRSGLAVASLGPARDTPHDIPTE